MWGDNPAQVCTILALNIHFCSSGKILGRGIRFATVGLWSVYSHEIVQLCAVPRYVVECAVRDAVSSFRTVSRPGERCDTMRPRPELCKGRYFGSDSIRKQ